MHDLAKRILEEGKKQNLFGESIEVSDVESVLSKCLDTIDEALQDDEDEPHYGEYLTEYRSRNPS